MGILIINARMQLRIFRRVKAVRYIKCMTLFCDCNVIFLFDNIAIDPMYFLFAHNTDFRIKLQYATE